jgi:hypothetical protein
MIEKRTLGHFARHSRHLKREVQLAFQDANNIFPAACTHLRLFLTQIYEILASFLNEHDLRAFKKEHFQVILRILHQLMNQRTTPFDEL